jgi:hypothetical protein
MVLLLALLPLFGLIVLANIIDARRDDRARRVFTGVVLAANLLVVAAGLGLWLLPAGNPAVSELQELLPVPRNSLALSMVVIGAWAVLACLTPVRRLVARVIPALDPASAVHALALVLMGYLAGNSLLALNSSGLEALAEAGVGPSIVEVVAQNFAFVLVAFLGVGLLTRRGDRALNERLGLMRPTMSQLLVGLRWMLVFVVLQACMGALWAFVDPERAAELNSLNDSLLGSFDTVWEWFLLAAATGVGEEMLFRGALQPVFGILGTSIVFAVSHTQYGLTPATLTVFLLSLVLGVIRQRSNTTVAIFVHAGYNFLLGLLALLASSLPNLPGS